jgi:hypothetical protein
MHGAASHSSVLLGLTLLLEGDGAPELGMTRVVEACTPLGERMDGYSLGVPADGSGAVL